MFIQPLLTNNPHVQLVKPDVERDAPLSVAWLAGPGGRQTLKMMGVTDSLNQPSNLEEETKRIQNFLKNDDQYNWMVQFSDKVVGSIWVDRRDTKKLKGPAVSLMIGDSSTRGQNVGEAAIKAVIEFLQSQGHRYIYACHIIDNQASSTLLGKLGFKNEGAPYTDAEDGLVWQTRVLISKKP